ncbi:MAG TPA: protein phosphatase 2C domain-containing protein [Natronosporangium sp.]|nr:protein phosphatase 2C domain-containing protein [Natronosporangium sp.]
MNLTLRYAARSDRGLVRDGNQDSVYAGPRLLAVADGMGGMAAGDIASTIVIAGLAPLDEDVPGDAPIDALRASVAAANEQLRRTVADNPELDGMGTTLTALLFSGSRAAMVHIGDSRAYLLRDGEFTQITRDDTYVQKLVDEGRISPEEAGSHPQRSLLTRAIDGTDIEPEYSVRQVLPGDRYLLCSDGLSGVVSAETIAQTLREYRDPEQCVDRLISLALRGGGPDNVTVIVADATDEDIVEAAPIVGGAAARDMQSQAARESTPATRASALTPPRPPVPAADDEDPDDEPAPPRHPVRHALLLLTLVGLLGGGLWYGWNATQSSYYVGATESGRVAVFQGLPGRVAGIELSRVYATSEVSVSDLTELAQERVLGGDIRRGSAEEARQTMAELIREHLKPLCPSPRTPAVTAPTPTPSTSPAPSRSASATPDATTPTPEQRSATPPAGASGAPPPVPPTPYEPVDCRTE